MIRVFYEIRLKSKLNFRGPSQLNIQADWGFKHMAD